MGSSMITLHSMYLNVSVFQLHDVMPTPEQIANRPTTTQQLNGTASKLRTNMLQHRTGNELYGNNTLYA